MSFEDPLKIEKLPVDKKPEEIKEEKKPTRMEEEIDKIMSDKGAMPGFKEKKGPPTPEDQTKEPGRIYTREELEGIALPKGVIGGEKERQFLEQRARLKANPKEKGDK